MKKKIALAMAAAMTVSALALNVSADEYTQVNLLVEGQAVETDQPAVIVDSRTMVPVRVIAETLGCEVDWDAATKTVTFTQGGIVATMVVGEKTINVNANGVTTAVEIDTPAVIINNRTMVPVRFLTELFGFNVDWDAVTKTVNVTAGEGVADNTASDSAVVVESTTEATTDSEESTEETTEEATDEDGNAEETTAEAADSKAELKAYAEAVDKGVAVLDNVSGGFNDDEQAEFAAQCDALATVLKEVSSDMTDEEIEAANEAVDEAKESFKTLAETYSVDSDFAEALGEYAE